jgi:hypothetical protein
LGCSFFEVVLAKGYMDNTQIATLTLAHKIVASALVTATAPHVPTIDLAPFLTDTPDGRRHVAQAIRDAFSISPGMASRRRRSMRSSRHRDGSSRSRWMNA